MKTSTLLLVSSLCVINIAWADRGVDPPPKSPEILRTIPCPPNVAQVTTTDLEEGILYDFISNVDIADWKAPKLEERLHTTYPNIVSVSIDPVTQHVKVILPHNTPEVIFIRILKHFRYDGYQVQ